jgi:hypothetical protein
MIFTLIVLVSAILAVACHILDNYTNKDLDMACVIFAAIALLVGGGSFTAFACSHTGVTRQIEKRQIEYQSLVKRVEIVNSEYEDVSKSDVIKDVAEWNKDVYDTKYYAESPWTNWLCSKKIADSLNYIELE